MKPSDRERCIEAFRKQLEDAPPFGEIGVLVVLHDDRVARLKRVHEVSELAGEHAKLQRRSLS